VEGILKMSSDTTYWNGIKAFIELSNITGATIQSITGSGVVDGNGAPFWKGEIRPDPLRADSY
jgi:galacturan 1,4-alpha-galacturonidase